MICGKSWIHYQLHNNQPDNDEDEDEEEEDDDDEDHVDYDAHP